MMVGLPPPAAVSGDDRVNGLGNAALFLITVPPLVANVIVLVPYPELYNSKVTLPTPSGKVLSSGKFKNCISVFTVNLKTW